MPLTALAARWAWHDAAGGRRGAMRVVWSEGLAGAWVGAGGVTRGRCPGGIPTVHGMIAAPQPRASFSGQAIRSGIPGAASAARRTPPPRPFSVHRPCVSLLGNLDFGAVALQTPACVQLTVVNSGNKAASWRLESVDGWVDCCCGHGLVSVHTDPPSLSLINPPQPISARLSLIPPSPPRLPPTRAAASSNRPQCGRAEPRDTAARAHRRACRPSSPWICCLCGHTATAAATVVYFCCCCCCCVFDVVCSGTCR